MNEEEAKADMPWRKVGRRRRRRYKFLRRLKARRCVELRRNSVITMVETMGESKTIFRNPRTNQTAAIDWAGPNEAPWSWIELQQWRPLP
jgi:hypothetical protein